MSMPDDKALTIKAVIDALKQLGRAPPAFASVQDATEYLAKEFASQDPARQSKTSAAIREILVASQEGKPERVAGLVFGMSMPPATECCDYEQTESDADMHRAFRKRLHS